MTIIDPFWLCGRYGASGRLFSELVQEPDCEALVFLVDIRLQYLKPPLMGYQLMFDFKENPFFTNSTLTKTYTYEVGDSGLFYGEVTGDTIDWRLGKMLPPWAAGGKRKKKHTTLSSDQESQQANQALQGVRNKPLLPNRSLTSSNPSIPLPPTTRRERLWR